MFARMCVQKPVMMCVCGGGLVTWPGQIVKCVYGLMWIGRGGIVTWFQEIQMQNPVRLAPTVLDILTLISNLPNMPLSPLLLNSLATVLARYFSISPLTSLTILLVRLMLVICTSAQNLSR